MRFLAALLLVLVNLAIVPATAHAQGYSAARVVSVERWVEEWDDATQSWVRVDEATGDPAIAKTAPAPAAAGVATYKYTYEQPGFSHNAARYAVQGVESHSETAIAQYGPFQVLEEDRAALMGSTNPMSPAFFDAMLRDFPELRILELIEAPGTSDDIANLAVGRRIRAAGIATHVPNGGSVRSGAVELFLAGATRTMENGAEFAVHSWLDNYGREPDDFAPDAPENRLYLDYYTEMGMTAERARDFYAMTNSVPHRSAKWLGAEEMRGWLKQERAIDQRGVQRARSLEFDRHRLAGHSYALELNSIHAPRLAMLDSQVAFP